MYTMVALLTLSTGVAAPAYQYGCGGCGGWSHGCGGCASYSSGCFCGGGGFCGSGFCGSRSYGCGGCYGCSGYACSGYACGGCASYSSSGCFCGSGGFCGKLCGGGFCGSRSYGCGGCYGCSGYACNGYACGGCGGVVYVNNCSCCGVVYTQGGVVMQGQGGTMMQQGGAATGGAAGATTGGGAATGSDKREKMPEPLTADEQKMLDGIKGAMKGKETDAKIAEYEAWYKKTATAEERKKDFKEFTGKDKP